MSVSRVSDEDTTGRSAELSLETDHDLEKWYVASPFHGTIVQLVAPDEAATTGTGSCEGVLSGGPFAHATEISVVAPANPFRRTAGEKQNGPRKILGTALKKRGVISL